MSRSPSRRRPVARHADRLVAAALVLAAATLYLSYRDRFPFWPLDEGYLYYGAFAIGAGAVPYADLRLLHYLPGIFDAFAALFAVTGPSIAAARACMAVGLALVPGLLFLAARRIAGLVAATGIALVALLVPGPWFLFYVPLLDVLLILGILGVQQGGRAWGILFGATVGLAWCTRMDLALTGGLVLLAWWACERWYLRRPAARALGAVVLGIVLIALPYQSLLAWRGVLADFYGQYLGFVTRLAQEPLYSSGLPLPSLRTGWLLYGSFVPVLALVLLAVRRCRRAASGDEKRAAASDALLAVWVVSNVPYYGIWRPDYTHLASHGVAVLLACAVVAREGGMRLRRGRWEAGRVVVAATLAGLVGYLATLAATLARHPCCGGVGIRRDVAWHTLSNGMRYPASTAPGGDLAPVLEPVIRETREDERVAALPYAPGLNFLARRRMPGRNVMVFPFPRTVGSPLADQEREVTADLARVRFAFYVPLQRWNVEGRDTAPTDFMPEIHRLLQSEFHPVARAGFVNLLRRREPAGRAGDATRVRPEDADAQ